MYLDPLDRRRKLIGEVSFRVNVNDAIFSLIISFHSDEALRILIPHQELAAHHFRQSTFVHTAFALDDVDGVAEKDRILELGKYGFRMLDGF